MIVNGSSSFATCLQMPEFLNAPVSLDDIEEFDKKSIDDLNRLLDDFQFVHKMR